MADIKLALEPRSDGGTGAARRMRHGGHIPGVLYGHGVEATSVAVEARALRAALSTKAGVNAVLELDVDGQHHLAMAKDIQRHPVRGTVAHIDFLVVNRDEVVTVDVAVHLIGEATEVNQAGGTVAQELHALTVQSKPGAIPTSIDVDIAALTIGGAIRVEDLRLPAGVATEVDPETAVVVGHAPVAEEEPAEAEGDAAGGDAATSTTDAGGAGAGAGEGESAG